MRNKSYKDDQKVFAFINSEYCRTLRDLNNLLYENNLPIRERWAFYYFGKTNWINSNEIARMQKIENDSYGGYVIGEVYYWNVYLSNEEEEKERIGKEVIENGFKPSDKEIDKKFIQEGIEFVVDSIEFDREWALDNAAYKHQQAIESVDEDSDTFCNIC